MRNKVWDLSMEHDNLHMFLRARPGTGKTTVINKVIAGLGDVRVGGFCTFFDPGVERPPRLLYMRRAGRENASNKIDETDAVARFFSPTGKPDASPRFEVYTERFNELGRLYIDEMKDTSDILVFDECSWLEGGAREFQAGVLAALDGKTPIIGVYRIKDDDTWTRKIENHPRVRTVDLTVENRDAAALELTAYFRTMIRR